MPVTCPDNVTFDIDVDKTGTDSLEVINYGFSKCQNMDMKQQLEFGVRYFDLKRLHSSYD